MSIIQTADINMPSDPAIIKKIKDACFEIDASMTRAESEKLFQKEAIIALADDTDIPKKFLTKMARMFHKQNRDAVGAEQEAAGELYDRIFVQQGVHEPIADGDTDDQDYAELIRDGIKSNE